MRKKILVVDDERDMVAIVQELLLKHGYEVMTAFDGKQALDLTPQFNPDLILLDYRMPELNGHEVCKQIKSNPQLKHIPVIFMTASPQETNSGTIELMHADDCIIKPFEPEELLKKISLLLHS